MRTPCPPRARRRPRPLDARARFPSRRLVLFPRAASSARRVRDVDPRGDGRRAREHLRGRAPRRARVRGPAHPARRPRGPPLPLRAHAERLRRDARDRARLPRDGGRARPRPGRDPRQPARGGVPRRRRRAPGPTRVLRRELRRAPVRGVGRTARRRPRDHPGRDPPARRLGGTCSPSARRAAQGRGRDPLQPRRRRAAPRSDPSLREFAGRRCAASACRRRGARRRRSRAAARCASIPTGSEAARCAWKPPRSSRGFPPRS